MDVFSVKKRSEVMSRIRGRGNKATELAFIHLCRRHDICGWRRNRKVFGRPDFVFPKERLAIFVDGCFWHSCPCHSTLPHNNRPFWRRKLAANRRRDLAVNRELRRRGWLVLRIWEHELSQENEALLVRHIRKSVAICRRALKKQALTGTGDN